MTYYVSSGTLNLTKPNLTSRTDRQTHRRTDAAGNDTCCAQRSSRAGKYLHWIIATAVHVRATQSVMFPAINSLMHRVP